MSKLHVNNTTNSGLQSYAETTNVWVIQTNFSPSDINNQMTF